MKTGLSWGRNASSFPTGVVRTPEYRAELCGRAGVQNRMPTCPACVANAMTFVCAPVCERVHVGTWRGVRGALLKHSRVGCTHTYVWACGRMGVCLSGNMAGMHLSHHICAHVCRAGGLAPLTPGPSPGSPEPPTPHPLPAVSPSPPAPAQRSSSGFPPHGAVHQPNYTKLGILSPLSLSFPTYTMAGWREGVEPGDH